MFLQVLTIAQRPPAGHGAGLAIILHKHFPRCPIVGQLIMTVVAKETAFKKRKIVLKMCLIRLRKVKRKRTTNLHPPVFQNMPQIHT